jgi:hypothetical protein
LVDREALRQVDRPHIAAVPGIGETLANGIKDQVGTSEKGERTEPIPPPESKGQRKGQTRLFDYHED